MFEFFKNSRQLLGMNSRNLEFIRPYNLKRSKKLADNKLLSKHFLKKKGIAVSPLVTKIKNLVDLENFDWNSLPNSFALKPNRGFGGEGIVVVYGRKKDRLDAWIKADSSLITIEDLKSHIRNILDGSFSLSNTPDIAFFEERLKLLKLFKPYSFKGIPDIRVIVFNKVPVMAMLRLPTKESGGKANLQQGAIGVGIDMATGVTTTAILGKAKFIEKVPGTRLSLSGIKIPYWKDILTLAVKVQAFSHLGYLGADVAIDAERGPVILELNARPGLGIQIANMAGLKKRLERVAGLKITSVEKGVRVGMDLFGGEVQEEVEDISGKKIIGAIEKVKIIDNEGKEIEVEAKIDTGAYSSSISPELAKVFGFEKTLEAFSQIDLSSYQLAPEKEAEIKKDFLEKYKSQIANLEDVALVFSSHGSSLRPVVKINFTLNQTLVSAKVNIAPRENLKYEMIIGKRDLKKFLIDITKQINEKKNYSSHL